MMQDQLVRPGRPALTARAKEIGLRIAQARVLAGKSATECAQALNLSISQYKYLERQCSPAQEALHLERLGQLFGVPVAFLAEGSESGTQPGLAVEVLSLEQAQWLGARAQSRREELGYSRNELAELIGASAMNVLTWEKSLPRKRRPIEQRWEQVLHVPEGWLRSTSLKAFAPPPFPSTTFDEGMTVAREIEAICAWFSRKNPYHRTVDHGRLNETEKRMTNIMLHRFGVYGERASTLQYIGDRIGVTRERVRQISEDFAGSLGERTMATPAIDRLKAAIQPSLPCRAEKLDRAFRALLGEDLSIVGADRFAREVLGRSIVKIDTNPANMQGYSTRVAVPDDAPEATELRAIRQVALSMVRTCGAAQLHFVAGMASSALQRGITPDEVLRCCRIFNTFEWLCEDDGWFWFGPAPENRAKTAAFKVLSVATRNIDVQEIHDAMARARVGRYDPDRARPYLVDIPATVLREVLARIPGIEKLQYNDFRLDVLVAPEEVLSDTELAIYRVIKQNGGVATRQTIVEQVLAVLDVTPMALNFALDGSPILVRIDRGIWCLRGTTLSTEAFSAAANRTANNRRFVTDTAAPVDGWWSVRVAVPESAFARHHWMVPVVVENLMQPGDYTVDRFPDPATLHVATNANLAGFVGKLVASGIGPNEVFLLQIHESERRLRFERLAQQEQPLRLASAAAEIEIGAAR